MNTAVKRIRADIRELHRHPSSRYHAEPMEDNLFEWHFTLRGPQDTEFAGGVYHGRILLPSDYPFKPPNFVFLTPNGRFAVNEKICLTISAHHPEYWQPAWGIRLILEALISFFPTEGGGALGALDWPAKERRRLAAESVEFCCRHCGRIGDILPDEEDDDENEEGGGGGEFAAEIAQLVAGQAQAHAKPEADPNPNPKPSPNDADTNLKPKGDEPNPIPNPNPKPEAKAEPEPEEEKAAEPDVHPNADPTPNPNPSLNLSPNPNPNPEPTPEPNPEPHPEPDSEPSADPAPAPQPEPEPNPNPNPSPNPIPEPEPIREAAAPEEEGAEEFKGEEYEEYNVNLGLGDPMGGGMQATVSFGFNIEVDGEETVEDLMKPSVVEEALTSAAHFLALLLLVLAARWLLVRFGA